ncbi:MAG: hypothetical protein IT266_05825 [Saprospiraceae bacterium]|nr:hypothetical protein [Saprospiraceae bacterium]
MKRNVCIVLIATCASIFLGSCRNTPAEDSDQVSSTMTLDPENPLLVPTPKGYYEPKGLRKLTILEMYELGTSGMFKKDFPVKDKYGNDVSWEIMDNPEKPMFMQMYANEEGHAVEAVVFEINDEVRNQILKVRLFSKPKEKDSTVVTPPPAEE